MPEQAILDLPVVDFDLYEAAMPRLHALCIENYGLAGFRPHPDAVFHFSASLWRYRQDESTKQIVGLSTFFLRALSRHVAARRRVAAVRSAMEDHSGAAMRARLTEADEDLAAAQEDLNEMSRLLEELIFSFTDVKRHASAEAEARRDANLKAMSAAGWARKLEGYASSFATMTSPRIDWSAGLDEVLEDIQSLDLPEQGPDGKTDTDSDKGLIRRLRRELEEYRSIASRAGVHLKRVGHERSELEGMIGSGRDTGESRSLAQANKRMAALRAERDQLAEDLLHAMSASTDDQETSEELFERLEHYSRENEDAAETIVKLTRRLETVQSEAAGIAEDNEELRGKVRELAGMMHDLRRELVNGEQRIMQANATIRALEESAGRHSEFERLLTESEERLIEAQRRQQEAEQRVEQLAADVHERNVKLKEAQSRSASQERAIEGFADRMRNAEALSEEREGRIQALESELDRLREILGTTESRLQAAQREAEGKRTSAQHREQELERLRADLEDERRKAESVSSESARLRRQITELEKLRDEVSAQKARLVETGQRASEIAAAADAERKLAADRHEKLSEKLELAGDRAATAEAEAETLRQALEAAERARASEREEVQALLRRERDASRGDTERVQKLSAEMEELRAARREDETFILKLQREFEQLKGREDGLVKEVGIIADLRRDYERADEDERPEIASKIARRIDGLFSSVGKPVHADRRTEKVVILTLKKSEDETATDLPRPFVATNRDDDTETYDNGLSDAQS